MSKATRAAVGTLALAVCLSGGALAVSGAAQAASGFTFGTPIAGSTSIDTSVAAAEAGFPTGSPSVVVVNVKSTVDGLTASYIAGLHHAPILYTTATTTPAQTTTEMAKLGARSVYVVGGTQAVAQSQLDAWTANGMNVTDYGGSDRYATAAVVAAAGGPQSTAFVASGDNAHLADALSVGGLAFQKHFPILLTRANGVPTETTAALTGLHATPVVVGGTAGVSDSAMAVLGSSVRLAGANRSQTAEKVADWSIATGAFTKTGIALVGPNNANAADALVAAPIAGMNLVPMLFAGTTDTNAYLATNAVNYTGRGFVFGGADAVPPSAISAATSAATSASPPPPPVVIPTSSLTSLADNGTAGTIDSSDVIRIKFSSPIATPGAGASIRLTDTDTTPTVADLVNGVNATFTVNSATIADATAFNGAAAGTVLTVTLTGAPTVVTAGSVTGLQTLATVTSASGIWSTSGGPWNLAGSPTVTAPVSAVQTLTVPTAATGGSFSIVGPSATVTGIVHGVSAATLAGNIATAYGISNPGLVTVTGPTAGVYGITFASSLGPEPTVATTSSLTPTTPVASSAVTTAGVTAVSDVQTLTFSASTTLTGGSFTLVGSGGGSGSASVGYATLNAPTLATISAAAATATGVTPTSVTGTVSGGFIVTFPSTAGPIPLMTVSGNSLTNSGGSVTPSVAHTTTGVAAAASVQTVTVPTTATAGTFTVAAGGGAASSAIPYTAGTLESALESAYGLGLSTVTVTGPSVSGVYTVTFPAGARAAITTTSSLTAAAVSSSSGLTTTGVLGVSGTVVG